MIPVNPITVSFGIFAFSFFCGFVWVMFENRRLRRREVLWEKICESTMKLAYLEATLDKGVGAYEKDRLKDKINELKQKLGYDKN